MRDVTLAILFALGIVAVAAVLFALDRLGLWLERRGWLYWRKSKPGGGARGVFTELQQLVEPEVRHVAQEKEQRRAERDEADPTTLR